MRKNLLLGLLVLQAVEDLLLNRADELLLLALALLSLVADPAVESGLDLGGEVSLLAVYKSVVLELGGFLRGRLQRPC